MAYIAVNKLEEVSIGQNMFYSGLILMRKIGDAVYLCMNDIYYKVCADGIDSGRQYANKVLIPGKPTRNVIGRFIAFKLLVGKKPAMYFTVSYSGNNVPILIHQTVDLGLDRDGNKITSTHFCYNPTLDDNGGGYTGSIGYVSKDLYNTAYNKSRLLTNAVPKVDYVKKAIALKKKIEDSEFVSYAYESSHEHIKLEDVFPQEMNKLYFISKLNNIIENYGNSTIYYSACLSDIERKFKQIVSYNKVLSQCV